MESPISTVTTEYGGLNNGCRAVDNYIVVGDRCEYAPRGHLDVGHGRQGCAKHVDKLVENNFGSPVLPVPAKYVANSVPCSQIDMALAAEFGNHAWEQGLAS